LIRCHLNIVRCSESIFLYALIRLYGTCCILEHVVNLYQSQMQNIGQVKNNKKRSHTFIAKYSNAPADEKIECNCTVKTIHAQWRYLLLMFYLPNKNIRQTKTNAICNLYFGTRISYNFPFRVPNKLQIVVDFYDVYPHVRFI